MSLFSDIAAGIATGLAVDKGKDATSLGARRVAEQAIDPEREGVYIDRPQAAPLWGRANPHLAELAALDARQAAIVGALLHEQRGELVELIAAIGNIVPQAYAEPFWFLAGDVKVQRNAPQLPEGGPWKLDGFTAWTDPAAAADATLLIACTGVMPIPLRIVATRNNPASVSIGLPISGDVSFDITPAAGGGGAATDRVALIARFTRNV